jgi:hypothetical protein
MGTRALLSKAIAREESRIAEWEGTTHPQIKDMLVAAKARKEAFEWTLAAMRGDTVWLRIAAGD